MHNSNSHSSTETSSQNW